MNRIPLKDISLVINSGLTPLRSNPEFWLNGNISWVKTEQLGEKFIYDSNEKITKYALENTSIKLNPRNTLSIAMYGEGKTRGSVSILKNETTTNQACCNIVVDKIKADFEFVYYNLKTQYNNLRNLSSGVRKNLNSNDIKNFEIFLPSLPTQKQIAKVLSDLDSKIEVNNKINQELEAMAKKLYDYWFVQFDFPDKNGKPYRFSGGKMVFNEALKREIPDGWEVRELGDISEIKRGKLVTAKTADLEGKYKVVSAGIDYSYLHSKYNRKKNTITVSGSGANAGYINFWREPIFANDCSTVRGKTDEETLVFLQFLKLRQDYILSQARGSAQPHVYPKDIAVLKIAITNNNLCEDYGKMVVPSNEIITNNLKQNQKLSELRDWLLPMLMNGQVTVGEAEEQLGMVAEAGEKYGA